jgi:hypothetical protein
MAKPHGMVGKNRELRVSQDPLELDDLSYLCLGCGTVNKRHHDFRQPNFVRADMTKTVTLSV